MDYSSRKRSEMVEAKKTLNSSELITGLMRELTERKVLKNHM